MKKIIAIALILLSCDPQNESITGIQSGLHPVLEIGESVKIDSNDGEAHFVVQVEDIEDGRCPMDAQCIWAGCATATIHIREATQADTIDLGIGECKEHRAQVEFTTGMGRWRLSLLSIEPLPRLNTPDLPKRASIKVERIG